MEPSERALLSSHMKDAALMVEFGSGGSTALALAAGVRRIVSVESDPAWAEKVLNAPEVAPAVAEGRVKLLTVNVGPVGSWGRPADGSALPQWPEYSMAPWEHVDGRRVDLVFIDGRFRVACALQAALRCPSAKVAMHDFWDRPQYHPVLPLFEWVASAHTMGVFTVRADLNAERIRMLYEGYALDPD